MLRVHYIGRMGNNLFQYGLGRIIHEKTGFRLDTANQNKDLLETFGIPLEYGSTRFDNQDYFLNCPDYIEGIVKPDPILINEHPFESVDEIISAADNRRGLILHGFFQRWHYYIDWKEKLKQWFFLPPWHDTPDSGDWIFHIRHEDYLASNSQIPFSYYEKIIDEYSSRIDRLYFIGKGLSQETIRHFQEKYPQFRTCYVDGGSAINDFRIMKSFSNIICSNSSYAWWAAFLSDAERVFIPQPQAPAYWSKDSAQDMFIPNSNHIRVEC